MNPLASLIGALTLATLLSEVWDDARRGMSHFRIPRPLTPLVLLVLAILLAEETGKVRRGLARALRKPFDAPASPPTSVSTSPQPCCATSSSRG